MAPLQNPSIHAGARIVFDHSPRTLPDARFFRRFDANRAANSHVLNQAHHEPGGMGHADRSVRPLRQVIFLRSHRGLRDLPPFTTVSLRVRFAALALNLFVRAMGMKIPGNLILWPNFLVTGLLNLAIPHPRLGRSKQLDAGHLADAGHRDPAGSDGSG